MTQPNIQKTIAVLLILICIGLIPLLSLVNKWLFDDPQAYGVRSEDKDIVQFEWFDNSLNSHTFPTTDNRITYLFMGFLSCSEICPIRIQQMHVLEQEIDKDPSLSTENINFMFISIDPENDTAELRKHLIDNRSPRFISASLNDADLMHLNQQLSEKINKNTNAINHVGNLFLISTTGKVERIYTAKQLSTDKMLVELKQYISLKA